jgi:hypothetical protein
MRAGVGAPGAPGVVVTPNLLYPTLGRPTPKPQKSPVL